MSLARACTWPLLGLAAAAVLAACSRPPPGVPGDPRRGAIAIGRASCGACHQIPGVPAAHGLVGPPLTHFSRRTMIAGVLPNTPDNLARWVRRPQSILPGNAMPDTGLSGSEARDVAAYLYGLR